MFKQLRSPKSICSRGHYTTYELSLLPTHQLKIQWFATIVTGKIYLCIQNFYFTEIFVSRCKLVFEFLLCQIDFKQRNKKYLFRTQSNIHNRVFCEDNERFLAVNYFHKKAPSQIFHWILNTPLSSFTKYRRQILEPCHI